MMFSNGRRLARLLAGVGLPVLAVVLAAPSAARASCGDYVVLGPTGDHHAAADPSPMSHPAHHDPAGMPRPCHGPHCSRGGTPLPVPVLAPPVTAEEWGYLPPLVTPAGGSRPASLFDDTNPRPVRRPSSVYHPPRLA
jgi:hypothetical protein